MTQAAHSHQAGHMRPEGRVLETPCVEVKGRKIESEN